MHAGSLDIQRCLFNLHRKMVPTTALQEKAAHYVRENLIAADMAQRLLRAIEQERGHAAVLNDEDPQPEDEVQGSNTTARLTAEEMKALLAKREAMMVEGDGETDQIRVYRHIIGCIQRGELLRLMVQASAGTGRPVVVAIIILIVIVCFGR